MRKLILIIVILILLTTLTAATKIKTLNGEEIELTSKLCGDEESGVDILGNDFYLYCEGNFEEEYSSIPEEFILEIENKDEQKGIEEYIIVKDNLSNKNDKDKGLNWNLFLGITGIILLLILITLIIAHKLVQKKDEKKQLIQLKPYLNNLQKKGYTKDQLEELLLNRGYKTPFINKILNQK